MAVTFAVGAVTGTVLSFEIGLLWPGMMGRYGDVFGIPFAIEGLFFFIEAIFIAIYIYGWKRLPPRLHLLSAVPIVIAGIGGAFSVVAANSWMNQPGGLHRAPTGKVIDVDRLGRALQQGDALRGAAHAARRLHGRGLPRRARSTRSGCCAGGATACTGSASRSRSRSRRSRRRSSSSSATPRRARSPRTSRSSSPRWSTCQQTASHVPEWIGGVYDDGAGHGTGSRSPTWTRSSPGSSTDTPGHRARHRPGLRPAAAATIVHLAVRHDGRDRDRAAPARAVVRCSLVWRRRGLPKTPLVPARAASLAGVGAVIVRSGAAGSSPRSGASRGSSTTCCARRTRSPSAGGIWIIVRGDRRAVHRRCSLGTVAAAARRWRGGGATGEDGRGRRAVRAAVRRRRRVRRRS